MDILEVDNDPTDVEYEPEKEDFQDESDVETKPRRSTTLGSRRSKTWELFYVEDDSNNARCKFCGKEMRYRSVADLKLHIDKDHARIEVDGVESSDGDKNVSNSTKMTRRTKLSTMIWKYFDVHDPDAKIAVCKACGKHLLYHTLNNLQKHLRRTHGRFDPGMVSMDSDEGGAKRDAKRGKYTIKSGPRRQRVNRSKIWNSFTIVDPDAKVAKCKLCFKKFAYTYLNNLNKHLNRKHPGETVEPSSDEGEVEIEVDSEQNTPVWAYFKCLDKTLKIASCLVCKKRIEYCDDQELIKHMNRKHPFIDLDGIKDKPKKLMITDNGEIYEIDESAAKQEPDSAHCDEGEDSDAWSQHNDEVEALHASETYLDENIFDDISQYTNTPKKLKLHHTTNQSTPEETSLDIFGKYMVSLLKKLPKQKSDELQVDFVRQIMEAQIRNDENNGYKSQVINTSYKQGISNEEHRITSNSEQGA